MPRQWPLLNIAANCTFPLFTKCHRKRKKCSVLSFFCVSWVKFNGLHFYERLKKPQPSKADNKNEALSRFCITSFNCVYVSATAQFRLFVESVFQEKDCSCWMSGRKKRMAEREGEEKWEKHENESLKYPFSCQWLCI